MKHFIIVLSLLTIGFNVQADEEKWKIEIAQYKKELKDRGVVSITGGILGNTTQALTVCSIAAVVATASVLTDTIPLTGIASEAIANFADPDYDTISTDDLLSWETFVDAGLQLEGGLLTGAEYAVGSLLFGDGDKHYPKLKKVYASSAAIIKELAADDAPCAKSLSKIVLLSGELYKRATGSSEDSENQEEQVEIPLH